MNSPYKRRKPSLLRNFWVYRRLVMVAVVLGLLLWFIGTNNEKVTISFPFRLGQVSSTTGLISLMSALVGSVATVLVMTIYGAFRSRRLAREADPVSTKDSSIDDQDLPPRDYAFKASAGHPPD